MSDTVLFVDDEEYVLNSIGRLFSDIDMRILKVANASKAIDLFSKEEIAVIISDNQMPGMKGVDLLSKVKEISPDTLKILMTTHTEITIAVEAVNKGDIFRFIIKPWENDALVFTVQEAVKRYQFIQSLKKGDEATLFSLAKKIELRDPYTQGHCERVARYALMIASALNIPEETKKDLKYGSWLHDCGKIGVPENILRKKGPLDEYELEIMKNHSRWGADLARQAQLSEIIVNITLYHHERYDGSGYPTGIMGNDIPLEARIVTIADVFDALTNNGPYRKRYSKEKAINIMKLMRGNVFDPEIVEIFLHKCLKLRKKFSSLPRNYIA